jgi:DNA-binding SARP family transcriptional activator
MQTMSNMTATAADAAVALRGALRTPAATVHWADAAALAPALALRNAVRVAPALTVKMLDGFRVWQGSEPLLALPHGRVRALLKLLLLQRRRPISRARLAGLFWPEADADNARNNLHVALHRLRRALGNAARLHLGDEGYQLVTPGEAWLDTEQFVQHAEAGLHEERAGRAPEAIAQYEAALALYHRDLLEEGEWECALAAEAHALRGRLTEVLERLSTLYEQRGDWHRCARAALSQLQIDDCNELAHQRAMRCYAKMGLRRLAEQQYRQCVDALRQQFNITPASDTTALYRRIAS